MHRYYEPNLPYLSPALVVGVWMALIAIFAIALYEWPQHHAIGVRHALPDPYVPQCYAVEWRSGSYCEFRQVNRHYRN